LSPALSRFELLQQIAELQVLSQQKNIRHGKNDNHTPKGQTVSLKALLSFTCERQGFGMRVETMSSVRMLMRPVPFPGMTCISLARHLIAGRTIFSAVGKSSAQSDFNIWLGQVSFLRSGGGV